MTCPGLFSLMLHSSWRDFPIPAYHLREFSCRIKRMVMRLDFTAFNSSLSSLPPPLPALRRGTPWMGKLLNLGTRETCCAATLTPALGSTMDNDLADNAGL